MNQEQRLTELFEEQRNCVACPRLVQNRTQVVVGRGNPSARMVIVGEAPGEQEDKEGRPFVGRAGGVLEDILETLRSDRPEEGATEGDFFILNSVACRPCTLNPLTKRTENTKPLPEELQNCRKWLHKAIRIIDPWVLILAGEYACQAFGIRKPIGQIQGKMIDVQVDGIDRPLIYAAMPVYHPAFLLRRKDKPAFLEETKRHFAAVVERAWAYMRVSKGLSPISLEEKEGDVS